MGYVLILAYALFRWGSGREALIGLGIMLVPATLSAAFDFTSVSETVTGFALFFLVLAAGLVVRSRTRERVSRIDAARANEREALARHDYPRLFELGAHPFLTLTLFIAMFERDHPEPLSYQKGYGAALAHLSLPYPDIAT